VPFQRTVNVKYGEPLVLFDQAPTAKQRRPTLPVVHETPASVLMAEPCRFGLGAIAQDVPFHRSINVEPAVRVAV
jgi:hypothetical protein